MTDRDRESTKSTESMRVLLATTDDHCQRAVASAVHSLGYVFLQASSCGEVLASLAERPAVVLLDAQFLDQEGDCQRLRAADSTTALAVVLLVEASAADAGPAGSLVGDGLGPDAVVFWPVGGEQLRAQIVAAKRLRQARDAARCERHRSERLLRQLVRSQRLAALGQVTAGLAHELSDPLTYLLHELEMLDEQLPAQAHALSLGRPPAVGALEELAAQAHSAFEGARRIRDVVRDLRNFVAADDEATAVSVNDVLDGVINLVFSEIHFSARLVKRYRTLPLFPCKRGSLSQLLLNLLVDAAHAADTVEGEVAVRTHVVDGAIRIEIRGGGAGEVVEPSETQRAVYQRLASSSGGTLRIEIEEVALAFIMDLPLPRSDSVAPAAISPPS